MIGPSAACSAAQAGAITLVPALFIMADDLDSEMAQGVHLLREAGLERAGAALAKCWTEKRRENKKPRKPGTWVKLTGGHWACLDADKVRGAEEMD